MRLKHLLIGLAVGFCSAMPSFANGVGVILQFDEKGNVSLTNNGVAQSTTFTQTGAFDSLGGSTLLYTLPTGYTFALAANVNQYAVIVTDSSSLVSDLLIFQNSNNHGQVIVFDSPAAAASESGTGDLAKAYLIPQQGGSAYGDPAYPDSNYPNPKSHPEYLNSPDYMNLALTHLFTNFAVSTVPETTLTDGLFTGALGATLVGGDSTIKVNGTATTTTVEFASSVPLPAAVWSGFGMLALLGLTRKRIFALM